MSSTSKSTPWKTTSLNCCKNLSDIGYIILSLQAIKSDAIPCTSSSVPSSLSPTKISAPCPVVLPTIPKLCSDSKIIDTDIVEDCSEDEALEDALLKEEQLDFSFSDDDSPLPSPVATPALSLVTSRGSSPPTSPKIGSSLTSDSGSRVWQNLFSSGQPTSSCTKL
ncbi:hypothetical protein NC651_002028 [Populus alba x Populus x berolinensis]|nr:hypothetical protein NC651_002028 [Populus alba x Populus x berolinensis]